MTKCTLDTRQDYLYTYIHKIYAYFILSIKYVSYLYKQCLAELNEHLLKISLGIRSALSMLQSSPPCLQQKSYDFEWIFTAENALWPGKIKIKLGCVRKSTLAPSKAALQILHCFSVKVHFCPAVFWPACTMAGEPSQGQYRISWSELNYSSGFLQAAPCNDRNLHSVT